MKRRFTISFIRSGQPRPYADSVQEFDIACEQLRSEADGWRPLDMEEKFFDSFAKAHGSEYYSPGETMPHPFVPILTSKTKIAPGLWRYVITSLWTD